MLKNHNFIIYDKESNSLCLLNPKFEMLASKKGKVYATKKSSQPANPILGSSSTDAKYVLWRSSADSLTILEPQEFQLVKKIKKFWDFRGCVVTERLAICDDSASIVIGVSEVVMQVQNEGNGQIFNKFQILHFYQSQGDQLVTINIASLSRKLTIWECLEINSHGTKLVVGGRPSIECSSFLIGVFDLANKLRCLSITNINYSARFVKLQKLSGSQIYTVGFEDKLIFLRFNNAQNGFKKVYESSLQINSSTKFKDFLFVNDFIYILPESQKKLIVLTKPSQEVLEHQKSLQRHPGVPHSTQKSIPNQEVSGQEEARRRVYLEQRQLQKHKVGFRREESTQSNQFFVIESGEGHSRRRRHNHINGHHQSHNDNNNELRKGERAPRKGVGISRGEKGIETLISTSSYGRRSRSQSHSPNRSPYSQAGISTPDRARSGAIGQTSSSSATKNASYNLIDRGMDAQTQDYNQAKNYFFENSARKNMRQSRHQTRDQASKSPVNMFGVVNRHQESQGYQNSHNEHMKIEGVESLTQQSVNSHQPNPQQLNYHSPSKPRHRHHPRNRRSPVKQGRFRSKVSQTRSPPVHELQEEYTNQHAHHQNHNEHNFSFDEPSEHQRSRQQQLTPNRSISTTQRTTPSHLNHQKISQTSQNHFSSEFTKCENISQFQISNYSVGGTEPLRLSTDQAVMKYDTEIEQKMSERARKRIQQQLSNSNSPVRGSRGYKGVEMGRESWNYGMVGSTLGRFSRTSGPCSDPSILSSKTYPLVKVGVRKGADLAGSDTYRNNINSSKDLMDYPKNFVVNNIDFSLLKSK